MARNPSLIPCTDLLNPDPQRRDGPTWWGMCKTLTSHFQIDWRCFCYLLLRPRSARLSLSGASLTPFCTKLVKVCACEKKGKVKKKKKKGSVLEHKWQVALGGEPQSAPWKSAGSEEGKSSVFSLAARWLKEKRQSLSFTSVQLPRRQMAEWEIFFFFFFLRVVEKMPGWKGLAFVFQMAL